MVDVTPVVSGATDPSAEALPAKIRALIVDDQKIACEALCRLLRNEPDVQIIGMCHSGQEAIEAIRQLSPDLVFLDVRMPGMDGFDVLGKIDPDKMPVVIFVTGTDDFAVRAFEVHALDYLVKPCKPERLRESLQRARKTLAARKNARGGEHLQKLLDTLREQVKPEGRMAVKSGGRVLLLKLEDINWVEAADNYVNLHLAGDSYLIRETLGRIEQRLPANKFLRISRSVIVNLEKVKELQPLFHGDYAVILRDGTRLTLSRNYRDKLKHFGLG